MMFAQYPTCRLLGALGILAAGAGYAIYWLIHSDAIVEVSGEVSQVPPPHDIYPQDIRAFYDRAQSNPQMLVDGPVDPRMREVLGYPPHPEDNDQGNSVPSSSHLA